ncbi:MAG: NAD(P)/FAD-dependent oxidoreductase [bacterium]
MIIIYDFKISINGPEKLKEDKELFTDNLSRLTAGKFKSVPVSGAKILKKSIDLRQKEHKIVFKAIIKFEHKDNASANIPGYEDDFINFLNKQGIKARKASNEEEDLFEGEILIYSKNIIKKNKPKVLPRVLIVGMGPAGIFAALYLLENGLKPILIEKGKPVEDRMRDVGDLLNNAKFNKKSNVVFGEGGAGTFSDGKLTTRKNDPAVFYILSFLVKMGAKSDILTEHKPHLGSDNLICILREIRNYLIKNGAEIYFEEELKDFEVAETGAVCSAKTDKRFFEIDCMILASGSNSYDTYDLLEKKKVGMERKPFAAGFRIEHKRDFIDNLFFKGNTGKEGVKLNGIYYNISSKKYGGYSFCMCPGGVVINSSSDNNLLCVNGMSYSKRDMENSNSAVVAAVRPEMLNGIDADRYSSETGALKFRKDLEFRAYGAGGGDFTAPFQYTADYIKDISDIKTEYKNKNIKIKNVSENEIPAPSYMPSVKYFNLFKLLPDFLNLPIAGSLLEFESKYKGFAGKSILTGLETGTSSAVRIKRNPDFESISVKGLYPCGEGSGYSGGIITSAIDGIRCAGALIAKKY